MTATVTSLVRAARVDDVRGAACLTVQIGGHTLVLWAYGDAIFAVDNRCPHMGFPLDRGTVKDGILTCHWHHARFDLASGGTFDQFADDVRAFPVELRDGEVWVDLAPRHDPRGHQRRRLHDGLERNIPLVVAKAVIALLEPGEHGAANGAANAVENESAREPFRIGLEFGVRYRLAGWGQGLTMHTVLMNRVPALAPEDHPRALYQGLSAVAVNTEGSAPRFVLDALPGQAPDVGTLQRWFRQFIEVRDAEGAERVIVTAVRAGAGPREMAGILGAAATDHRYLQIGHVLDFTNKAFEALDHAGWEHAERVLTSLVPAYAMADRMEESNAWRNPVDLVEILERAFEQLPAALEAGARSERAWSGRDALVQLLLGENPQASADALLDALRGGATPVELAGTVTYAAALRIARFHISNEFGDWDTALHTFTFANAVHQLLIRTPSRELVRGVFDAAMSVYLDRFLNVPAARLPLPPAKRSSGNGAQVAPPLSELAALLDRQQQVDAAGEWVAQYLYAGGDTRALVAALGHLLLREDRDFHTIQTVESAVRQHALLGDTPEGVYVLVAAARYLAAHAPTMRAQGQTFQIAQRLARGERLFDT